MAMSSSSSIVLPSLARQQCTAAHAAALQGLCMPRSSLKNAAVPVQGGSRLLGGSLLGRTPLRSAERHSCAFFTERRGAGAMVQASSIGVVKDVKRTQVIGVPLEVTYFNVTLSVLWGSEVAKWYKTPGGHNSQQESASSFFIASPPPSRDEPLSTVDLEFLIEDVPNTVANEIINSKPGDRLVITPNPYSDGFNMSEIEAADSVLMFASGYGLGPIRALIEKGFQAKEKKQANLYLMYRESEEPYVNEYSAWEATGVTVYRSVINNIPQTNPVKTVVPMVASTIKQEVLAKYFESVGVPAENILTLFGGISTSDNAYYNKVTHKLKHYPKFLHSGPKNAPVQLKI